MKRIYTALFLCFLSFSVLWSGELIYYERDKDFKYLFLPDTMTNITFEYQDTNYTFFYATRKYEGLDSSGNKIQKSEFCSRLLYKNQRINKKIKVKINDKDVEFDIGNDSRFSPGLENTGWLTGLYYNDSTLIYYNLLTDSVFVFHRTFIDDNLNVLGKDTTVRMFIKDMFITPQGKKLCRSGYPFPKEGIERYMFYEYKNNKWERYLDTNTLLFHSDFLITDNDEIYYPGGQGICKIEPLDRKIHTLFNYDTVVFGDRPEKLYYKTRIYLNKVTDALVFNSYKSNLIITYNLKTKKFFLDTNIMYETLELACSQPLIDSRGTIYRAIADTSVKGNRLLIRDTSGKFEIVPLPRGSSCHSATLYNKDNIWIDGGGSSFWKDSCLIYNHYKNSSIAEDDYFGKSILFKSPYLNPVTRGTIRADFFSMPYIIQGLTMDLYDVSGKLIKALSKNINYNPGTGLGSYSFKVDDIPKGVYYLVFNSSNYRDCKMIVVE